MLRFLFQVAQGDEQGEVSVLMAGFLELRVQMALNVFPDAVAPGLDHHAAAHFGIFSHVGRADDLLVPLRKIFVAARSDGGGGLAHGIGVVKKGDESKADGPVVNVDVGTGKLNGTNTRR